MLGRHPLIESDEVTVLIVPISQMRKLSPKEVIIPLARVPQVAEAGLEPSLFTP